MKLNEVIDTALVYLNLNDEIKVTGADLTPLSNRKLRILLRCANIVYSEIASDYMPLKAKETLVAIDNKVAYQSFSRRVIEVVKVVKDGANIPFSAYPNYLEVNAQGEVEIIYHYLPQEISLDDEIEYGVGLSPTAFAAGIAAEYSLVNGMYDEAVAFDRKYREALIGGMSRSKSGYIKGRRWLN
ncbi:MAG: hypothetical protein ACOX3U_00880 [Christensenellales bacterium]|jgi:hypothetical protein